MNTKNNLQNALRNAFNDHEEPLNEAQWLRLEGAIVQKRSWRRYIPLLLIFLLVFFTSGITYLLTMNYVLQSNHKKGGIQWVNSNPEGNFIFKSENESTPFIHSLKNDNSSSSSTKKHNNYTSFSAIRIPKNKQYTPEETSQPIVLGLAKDTLSHSTKSDTLKLAFNTDLEINQNNTMPEATNTNSVDSAITIVGDLPLSGKALKNKNEMEKEKGPKTSSKFAFSLSTGYSKMNVKVSNISNSEKLHKDTRQLFEESNKNHKTTFVNFGLDYNLLPGLHLGINSGIQVLKISTPVNIHYQWKDIAFREADGTITGYISNSNPLDFQSNSTNITTYIIIPLRLNYSIPINAKNEVILSAGANFSSLVGAKGKIVSINEGAPEVSSLDRSKYRPFNAGFNTGMQYCTHLKKSWWLGAETQWQSNAMKYNVGNGSINNTLNGYSINLILKYKI